MNGMAASRTRIENLPRNLKPYYLALFRPGERWNQTEGAEELPSQQLAFLRAQFESGVYRAAGPVTDGGAISAMAIIEAESLEAAKRSPSRTRRSWRRGLWLRCIRRYCLRLMQFA